MTDIPADGTLADAGDTLTTALAKVALEKLRDVLAELPGGAATSELTISGGSITPTGFLHSVDTEGAAGSDNLANVVTTNHPESRLLLLYPEDGGRTVVVKDAAGGAGQIHTADGNDFTMDETDKMILLYRDGADWREWGRSYGTSIDDNRTYLGLGTAAVKDHGVANGNVPAMDATGYPAADGSQITDIHKMGYYVLLQDQKASGTVGGTFNSGAWHTRTLNTEVADTGADCSLAANQFTLAAGTYYIRASAPAVEVDEHQAMLRETTSTLPDIIGTSERSDATSDTCTRSIIEGPFTITSGNVSANQNIFEIKHRCITTGVGSGYGDAGGFGVVEIYTTVQLWKVV